MGHPILSAISIKSKAPSEYVSKSIIDLTKFLDALVDVVGYKPLLPSCGSARTVALGKQLNSIALKACTNALRPPSNPADEITERSSKDVWYSGYSPYLLRIMLAMGKSTPGAQYWRSSLPRWSHEYLLYFGSIEFNICLPTRSERVFPSLEGMNE